MEMLPPLQKLGTHPSRPLQYWLEWNLDHETIAGLRWFKKECNMWCLPWEKHARTKPGDPLGKILVELAKFKYQFVGDEPTSEELKLWKTNLRSSLNNKDHYEECKAHHFVEHEVKYMVYKFCAKDVKRNEFYTTARIDTDANQSSTSISRKDESRCTVSRTNCADISAKNSHVTTQQKEVKSYSETSANQVAFHRGGAEITTQEIEEFLDFMEPLLAQNTQELRSRSPVNTTYVPAKEDSDNIDTDTGSSPENLDLINAFQNLNTKNGNSENHIERNHNVSDRNLKAAKVNTMHQKSTELSQADAFLDSLEMQSTQHNLNFRSRSPINTAHVPKQDRTNFETNTRSSLGEPDQNLKTENNHSEKTIKLNQTIPTHGCQQNSRIIRPISIKLDCEEEMLRNIRSKMNIVDINDFYQKMKLKPRLGIECFYLERLIGSFLVADETIRISFKDRSEADEIGEQHLPECVSDIILPSVPANMFPGLERYSDVIQKVLIRMKKGIMFQLDGNSIYAQRYCAAVPMLTIPETDGNIKLERNKKTNIFDFPAFLKTLETSDWTKLKSYVRVTFAMRYPDAAQVHVVKFNIYHIDAWRMMHDKHKDFMETGNMDPVVSNEYSS